MGRTTCCLVVPLHPAAIVISVLGVIAGGVFGVGYAVNIYNAVVFIPGTDTAMTAIPYVGMVFWMALAVISFFGFIVCWRQHSKLVSVYFWLLLVHYLVDLGILIANIIAASTSARQALDACQKSIKDSGLTGDTDSLCQPISPNAILFLTILGIYKLIATYTTFVIFKYKRFSARQAEERATIEAMKKQQPEEQQQQQVDGGDLRNWSKFDD